MLSSIERRRKMPTKCKEWAAFFLKPKQEIQKGTHLLSMLYNVLVANNMTMKMTNKQNVVYSIAILPVAFLDITNL